MSGILASPEFGARAQALTGAASSDQAYVQALYLLLLNRAADAGGLAASLGALPTLGRQGVAVGFLISTEYRTDLVGSDYDLLLHRPADPEGLNDWVFSGLDAVTIRVGIEASPEFFANG